MTPVVGWVLATWFVVAFAALGTWTLFCALARRRQSRDRSRVRDLYPRGPELPQSTDGVASP